MNEDDYLDSVEVIQQICTAYENNTLPEIQAIRGIAGILYQDAIKKIDVMKIIGELCKAYNNRTITKEAAIFGILGRLSIIENLNEIMEDSE